MKQIRHAVSGAATHLAGRNPNSPVGLDRLDSSLVIPLSGAGVAEAAASACSHTHTCHTYTYTRHTYTHNATHITNTHTLHITHTMSRTLQTYTRHTYTHNVTHTHTRITHYTHKSHIQCHTYNVTHTHTHKGMTQSHIHEPWHMIGKGGVPFHST